MTSFRMSGRRVMQVAAVALVASALSACAVTPEPLTQQEFADRAAADLETMFKDQAPLEGPLTLQGALTRVLKYNLDVRAKMMEEALALGQLEVDQFDMLPKLMAEAGYTNRSEFNATTSRDVVTQAASDSNPTYSSDRDTVTAGLSETWNILDFGASYFTAHQSADRALIAAERRRRTMQNLAQEVRFAFWRAAAAQVLQDKVSATVKEAEKALADAERVEAERLRDPADALRTQKTLLESLRQLEAIDREMSSAKAELAALVNLPPGSDFRLATGDAMTVPKLAHSVEEMEELALTNNPDLREQEYSARIAADETRKAIVRLLPGISFSISREYDSNSFLDANRWSEVGARLSFNLFNLLSAPARIDQAETAEKVVATKRLALRMAVLAQVHVAATQYSHAARAFSRADKQWSVESRLLTAMRNQSRGGVRSAVERVTSETSAITAELRRYQTYAQVQAAFGRVRATIGADDVQSLLADGADAAKTAASKGTAEVAPEAAPVAATTADAGPDMAPDAKPEVEPAVVTTTEPAEPEAPVAPKGRMGPGGWEWGTLASADDAA